MENEQQTIDQKKCDCGSCWKCRGFFGSKLNTVLLLALIVLMVVAINIMLKDKQIYLPVLENKSNSETKETKDTYTYENHGFSVDLPQGFVPGETESEGGPYISIIFPDGNGVVTYIRDMDWWKKHDQQSYTYLGDEKIGSNSFSIYKYNDRAYPESNNSSYLYQKGNAGYMFSANEKNKELLKTFKFIGWN